MIWFALVFLVKHQPDSDLFTRIALNSAANLRSMDGYDLWLQRRAFLACIQHHGVGFVLAHDKDLRRELIYYALLKRAFSESDIAELENHLHAHGSPGAFMNLSSGEVLQLIAERGRYLTRLDSAPPLRA